MTVIVTVQKSDGTVVARFFLASLELVAHVAENLRWEGGTVSKPLPGGMWKIQREIGPLSVPLTLPPKKRIRLVDRAMSGGAANADLQLS